MNLFSRLLQVYGGLSGPLKYAGFLHAMGISVDVRDQLVAGIAPDNPPGSTSGDRSIDRTNFPITRYKTCRRKGGENDGLFSCAEGKLTPAALGENKR